MQRLILATAAAWLALGCTSSLTLGCSNSPTEMPERGPCPSELTDNRYASVTLAPTIDGAVFFSVGDSPHPSPLVPDSGTPLPAHEQVGSVGAICRTASDRAACLAKVEAMRSPAARGWSVVTDEPLGGVTPAGDYGVVSSGDDVRLLANVEDLRAAIAPIDGVAEAASFAVFAGRGLDCGVDNARTVGDGVVLRFVNTRCNGESYEFLYEVHHDGSITDVSKRKLSSADDDCIE
jgi:hypothetical protein